MRISKLLVTAIVLSVSAGLGCAKGQKITTAYANSSTQAKKTMHAFQSEEELAKYFKELAEKKRGDHLREANNAGQPAPASVAKSSGLDAASMAKDSKDDESVTNVQHAGVDEGGIVKLHGDHLVVLRRGRLFTVAIGNSALKPISVIDAFAPDIDPGGSWYDEMLVSEDTIAVIGYSYQRGGTEVGLFNIDRAGNLGYRATYHLRSNDYYSSRNYASRLIGNKLVFYTPLYIWPGSQDPFQNFPAMRKWHKGAGSSEFRRIVSAKRIFRPEAELNAGYGMALHTVTVCDLGRGDMQCAATGVVGPAGRVFYVSPESVYVWTTDWTREGDRMRSRSMVYRMPLDGSSPSALGVSGAPVDQFSFLESEDKNLNVLVRSGAAGDGMWDAEGASGDVALMRVPLTSFSDGSESAPSSNYQKLPTPKGYTFQNRFVGEYLLYGTGSGWGAPETSNGRGVYAVRWSDGEVVKLPLVHGVDRIESMGSDAVVVGTDGNDLHFTAVRLDDAPAVAFDYKRKGASQGELRSQGFFYKADGPDSGILGLPISEPARAGYKHLFTESASILFLHNESLNLQELGNLVAHPKSATADKCRASCVDWYGNSRPLFVRGRVFALLGYEIVEGTVDDGRIRETRRINYSPKAMEISRK